MIVRGQQVMACKASSKKSPSSFANAVACNWLAATVRDCFRPHRQGAPWTQDNEDATMHDNATFSSIQEPMPPSASRVVFPANSAAIVATEQQPCAVLQPDKEVTNASYRENFSDSGEDDVQLRGRAIFSPESASFVFARVTASQPRQLPRTDDDCSKQQLLEEGWARNGSLFHQQALTSNPLASVYAPSQHRFSQKPADLKSEQQQQQRGSPTSPTNNDLQVSNTSICFSAAAPDSEQEDILQRPSRLANLLLSETGQPPIQEHALRDDICNLSLLGRGGCGSVYKGEWRGSVVAVKLIVSDCSESLDASLAEAIISRMLAHPHIVQSFAAVVIHADQGWMDQAEEVAWEAKLSPASTCTPHLVPSDGSRDPKSRTASAASTGSAGSTAGRSPRVRPHVHELTSMQAEENRYFRDVFLGCSCRRADPLPLPLPLSSHDPSEAAEAGSTFDATPEPQPGQASRFDGPSAGAANRAGEANSAALPLSCHDGGAGQLGCHTTAWSSCTAISAPIAPLPSSAGQRGSTWASALLADPLLLQLLPEPGLRATSSPGVEAGSGAPVCPGRVQLGLQDQAAEGRVQVVGPRSGKVISDENEVSRPCPGGMPQPSSGAKSSGDFCFGASSKTEQLSLDDAMLDAGVTLGRHVTAIVIEYCDRGHLGDMIRRGMFVPSKKWGPLTTLRALARTAKEVAQGLAYLHSMGITHGDLKPSNVLLKSSRLDRRGFVARIADFGFASASTALQTQDSSPSTLTYSAPEAIDGPATPACDMWSFGVMLNEMVTGKVPFAGLHWGTVMAGLLSGSLQLEWPEDMDPMLQRLGQAATQYDPAIRPSARVASKVLSKLRG